MIAVPSSPDSPRSLHLFTERACHLGNAGGARFGLEKNLQRAISSIRNRQDDEMRLGEDASNAQFHAMSDL